MARELKRVLLCIRFVSKRRVLRLDWSEIKTQSEGRKARGRDPRRETSRWPWRVAVGACVVGNGELAARTGCERLGRRWADRGSRVMEGQRYRPACSLSIAAVFITPPRSSSKCAAKWSCTDDATLPWRRRIRLLWALCCH